jgi:hypothetical protein
MPFPFLNRCLIASATSLLLVAGPVYAELLFPGSPSDGLPSLIYNIDTGDLTIDKEDDQNHWTSIEIHSAFGRFRTANREQIEVLPGPFDELTPTLFFHFPNNAPIVTPFVLDAVYPAGVSIQSIASDLDVRISCPADGCGVRDFYVVPEPATGALVWGSLCMLFSTLKKRRR